jgi:hypothetical protein
MCFVSSNVCVVPGATILAMDAVVIGELQRAKGMDAGVAAKLLKMGIEGGAYFRRSRGVAGLHVPDGLAHPGLHA